MTRNPEDSTEKTDSPTRLNKKEISHRNLIFWDIGATVGLLGGTWFFAAAVFMTISEFLFSEQPEGSWMFLAVLPLWVIGALCYDKTVDADKPDLPKEL